MVFGGVFIGSHIFVVDDDCGCSIVGAELDGAKTHRSSEKNTAAIDMYPCSQ